MRIVFVAAALLGCVACESSLPRGEAIDARGEWEFGLVAPSTREGDGDRAVWRLTEPAVTVTAQRIPRRMGHEDRTLQEVADAIVERYAAGEVDGSMTSEACAVAGGEAVCLDGWIQDENRRLLRRGVVVLVGNDLVVLEVIGTDQSAVDRQAELLSNSFHETAQEGM